MRTDLAKESGIPERNLKGISKYVKHEAGAEILLIDVETKEAAEKLDKPIGRYITVTSSMESMMDRDARMTLSKIVSRELRTLVQNSQNTLVIGLGNRYIAADALGTKTAEYVFVTRHVLKHMKGVLPQRTPSVSAFCSNVLGMTGMETVEVVSALTKEIAPDVVILIDSLAASRVEHLGCVIQCNDSGIAPGAGVGNFQTILSKESLGVPVIAVGVPLVVGIESILGKTRSSCDASVKNMIVTPKEIDMMVKDASRVLSDAINLMLFGDTYNEIEKLLR